MLPLPTVLLAFAAGLAAAPPAAGPNGSVGEPMRALRAQALASAVELDLRLARIDDLTASYAADDAPADEAAREALVRGVQEEAGRMSKAYADFWSRWDSARLEQGVALIKAAAGGQASADATGRFFDTSDVEDFKAVIERAIARVKATLDREAAARAAARRRRDAARAGRWAAAAGGAAAAGLAAAALAGVRARA